jgi:hypothetical protein
MNLLNYWYMRSLFLIIISSTLFACFGQNNKLIDTSASTIKTRYLAPVNYSRSVHTKNSFAYYLENLSLKPFSTEVKYFNGNTKTKGNVYSSVIDQEISSKDLQQCADACMRLRGEYLFHTKQYDKIHFNFLSDGKPRFYNQYTKDVKQYANFLKYMDWIFAYANTGSLYNELSTIAPKDIQIGDVIIQKKQPYGHAIMVVDMVIDNKGSKKILLSQSYMPAQETQILVNPKDGTPWFDIPKEGESFQTPEWTFETFKVGRFK